MARLTPEAAAIVLLKQARELKLDTPKQLRSAADADALYRRAAILAHPDKRGGDAEVMKALNEAIAVLRMAEERDWPLPPSRAVKAARASNQSVAFETSHRAIKPRSRQGTVVEIHVQPNSPAPDPPDKPSAVAGVSHEQRQPPDVPWDEDSKIHVVYDRAKPGRPPRIISNLSPDDPLLVGDPYWSPFAEDAVGGAEPLEFTNIPRPTPPRAKTRYHAGNEISEQAKQELFDGRQAPPPEPPGEAGTPQP